MPNIKVTVTDNSKIFKDAKDDAIRAALEAIAEQAEGYAVALCPVDTSRLKNSISHAVEVADECAYIGTNVEYAPYVEFGTSKMAAQPFLKPAIANHVDEYKDIAMEHLKGKGG